MSLDIDWSLLSSSTTESSLSKSLVDLLNSHLATTSRPSFVGPITVTHFDFGTIGPEVEIKDIGDVWRAFDEGDEEGDLESGEADEDEFFPDDEDESYHYPRRSTGQQFLDDEPFDIISPSELSDGGHIPDDVSVFSGIVSNRHQSVAAAVGIGLRGSASMTGYGGLGLAQLNGGGGGSIGGFPRPPSVFSAASGFRRRRDSRIDPHQSRRTSRLIPHTHIHSPSFHSSPPPSPPAKAPNSRTTANASNLPSIQLHLHLSHSPNLTLTLLTSLQINYPSQLFMALPLKLSITGFTLAADLVVAYSGQKNRVHVCVVDPGDEAPHASSNANFLSGPASHAQTVGQRLLPNLQIESEIGHADAHVLRNVGKVERFIVDVVRKTLVDELVFPNFHTVAM